METNPAPDLIDLTLLVITPDFPDEKHRYVGGVFVKHQLDEIRKHFGKVVVIAPVPRSFGRVSSDRFCRDYSYDNVSVFFPRAFFVPRRLKLPFFDAHKLSLDLRPRAVERLIEREGIVFDLVHAHFTWPSGGIAQSLKEQYHVKVVLTVHEDSGWLAEEVSSGNPKFADAWEAADAVIRVNRKDISLLEKYNSCVMAIPNGYAPEFRPMDREKCRRKLGILEGRKVLFSLGYLVDQKGFRYLIDAMVDVCNEREDVDCYIGGNGPLRGQLEDQIRGLDLSGRVKLLGFVDDVNVPIWMNAADLFVLPSLYESFGIVQIEAMAVGTPVIATRNGGSEEIITSDTYGYLVDPREALPLAVTIIKAIERPWNHAAIQTYATRFSWVEVVKEIVSLYGRVLNSQIEPQP